MGDMDINAEEPEMHGLIELVLELCPEDVEDTPLSIYSSVSLIPLEHVEWRGYTTEPLGFGINLVIAVCRVYNVVGAPEPDMVVQAAFELSCVQAAKVRRYTSLDDDSLDPFDLCWLHLPKPFDSGAAPVKCGIVSTFRDAPNLDSWIKFHAAVGFSRFWLYVDAPDEDGAEAAAAAATHPGVTLVPRDERLRSAWRQQSGWKVYGHLVDAVNDHSAVMARQCLNGEHAAASAQAEGIDWLLHIDLDELACPGREGGSIAELFGRAGAKGANAVVFPNHEVAPESEGPYTDPFREATLFKVSERLRSPGKGVSRFLAYGNGKSAVKLSGGVRPEGVHKWVVPTPAVCILNPEDGFLLHYVNCGFEAIRRKYAILGAFQDKWFGRDIAMSTPFHTAARDAAHAGNDALLELYRLRVMYDEACAATLLEEGALIRVHTPSRILGH